jgi:isopentenyl phosphate kinase
MKKDYNILVDLKMTLCLSDATQKHVDYVLQNIDNIIANLSEHLKEEIVCCDVDDDGVINDNNICPQFAYLDYCSSIDAMITEPDVVEVTA